MRLGGPQNRSEVFGGEVNLWPQPGTEPKFLGRSALSLVSTPVTLNVFPKLVSWLMVQGEAEDAVILHRTNTVDTIVSASERVLLKFDPVSFALTVVLQVI
jgi:hypothetical protein